MEDDKLADYYDELKAAAPKGGRGGLGAMKGSFKGGFGFKNLHNSSSESKGKNGLYSMFVKEGATGYTAWDSDDEDKPQSRKVDARVGLIPCMAVIKAAATAAEKAGVSEFDIRKHCKAALKSADGRVLRIKELRNQVVQRVGQAGCAATASKVVKSVWPSSPVELGELLGDPFVIEGKSVRLGASKPVKKEKQGGQKGKKRRAEEVTEDGAEPLPQVNWKKHCKAALSDAPGRQLKPKELRKEVVQRVFEKWNGWGGEEVRARLQLAAKEALRVTSLGAKFEDASGYVRLK